MARTRIRELEDKASNRILAERKRRSFFDSAPLSLSDFTETLSGSSFFNTHGVTLRRMGVFDIEAEQRSLEESIKRIGECANAGLWPTLSEIRDILHPPFESFAHKVPEAAVVEASAINAGSAVVAIEGNVFFADFRPSVEAIPQQNVG